MRVRALVTDLMDRSRISAAIPGVEFGPVADAPADVVIVDLARSADRVAEIRAAMPHARIVGFGPHVDDATAQAARDAGADLVLPRSRFFHDPAAAIATP